MEEEDESSINFRYVCLEDGCNRKFFTRLGRKMHLVEDHGWKRGKHGKLYDPRGREREP